MRDPESTFWERMDDLSAQVGQGLLHGTVTVDQVYARYQDGWGDEGDDTGVITPTQISHAPGEGEFGHPGPWTGKPGPAFDHPKGGEAGYLTMSLTTAGPDYAQRLADAIGEEVPMSTRMIELVEDLAAKVPEKAPLEIGSLRGSATTKVVDDGKVAYDRPAVVPRLSQGVLDALRKIARKPGGPATR